MRAKFNLLPQTKYDFLYADFREFTFVQWHNVGISYIVFHPSQLKDKESAGINSFVPLSNYDCHCPKIH